MREVFAKITWTIDDVLMLSPDWTRAQASEFLDKIETDLETAMFNVGWEVIYDKLDMGALKN
jgi:hypothetical protein